MNKHYAHLAAAVIGTLAVAGTTLAASPANAAGSTGSKVTAAASDRMPASGQMFRVSGTVSTGGHGTPEHGGGDGHRVRKYQSFVPTQHLARADLALRSDP